MAFREAFIPLTVFTSNLTNLWNNLTIIKVFQVANILTLWSNQTICWIAINCHSYIIFVITASWNTLKVWLVSNNTSILNTRHKARKTDILRIATKFFVFVWIIDTILLQIAFLSFGYASSIVACELLSRIAVWICTYRLVFIRKVILKIKFIYWKIFWKLIKFTDIPTII